MRPTTIGFVLVLLLSGQFPVMAHSSEVESTTESSAEEFPFVYLGAGDVYQRKWMTLWIWFEQELTDQEMGRIVGTAPLPFLIPGGQGSDFFRIR